MKIFKIHTFGIVPVVLGSFALCAGAANAENSQVTNDSNPLSGCYQIVRGSMEESAAADGKVIGTYRFTLAQIDDKKAKRIVISGPIGGAEGGGEHEEGEESEEGEIHGGHTLGTFNRTGTFSSNEDEFVPTSAECLSDTGVPQKVKGIETLKFNQGTGIFSGLTHGEIAFDVVFDACTNPANPVADLKATAGELCFE